jgi:hypothetical protein
MLTVCKNFFFRNLQIVTGDSPVCSVNLSSAIGGSESQNVSGFLFVIVRVHATCTRVNQNAWIDG